MGAKQEEEARLKAEADAAKAKQEKEDVKQKAEAEKAKQNQASGMQETQRLLQGEQMEEKYLAPGQEGKPERIIFTLHSAKDLASMDYMGKSDPYAILTYGSQERRTTTINNNLNPTWNHEVTFDYEENVPTIDIDVFDEDTMAKDNSLGRLSIDVAEIKRNKAVTDAEASFEESSSGSIKYSAEFVTSFTSLSTKQKTLTSHQVESMQSDIEAAKAKQEEEARLKAEAEADKAKQEEEAKQKAEAEKAKQEEEARLKAEAEAAKAKQEEEAKLKFEAEAAKAKEEEEARLIALAEAAKAKQA